jgi:hypothetical protein
MSQTFVLLIVAAPSGMVLHRGPVEAFMTAWRIMTISTLPPVLFKTQPMRIENGSRNTRNTHKGVLL